ncbi:MAG: SEC-C domain-containing protein [Pseudomonadales bacterium]|nr:SEC-C domain-containing protein [Pseudomonadales bacterium]MBO6563816.1 SEC-C domain-containing protein [Pseudomonadales bacterium]MBO6594662.1 SEC-C domain-containing protein [Pseudomonadales bacterium]MBO6655410.1 SEC-C domain-containing protein [Pseudomonadales bacterium]MBO6701166.1 SEC-C domain-containing protein [Pseudomonadales bacterium]
MIEDRAKPSAEFSPELEGSCGDPTCCPPQMPVVRNTPKVGRNDPCPCASGHKYKKCCGKN